MAEFIKESHEEHARSCEAAWTKVLISMLPPRVRTCCVTRPPQRCCAMACPWIRPASFSVTAAST
jgi:hypothetical protein